MMFTRTPVTPSRILASDNGEAPAAGQVTEERLIKSYLHLRDVPCPNCRYNLRDLSGLRCPECGAALTIHISSSRIPLGSWFLAVIATSVPFGFSFTMSALGVYGSIMQVSWFESDWWALLVLLSATVICAAALVFLAWRRHRWVMQSRPLQWFKALAVVSGAGFLTFVLVVILTEALR